MRTSLMTDPSARCDHPAGRTLRKETTMTVDKSQVQSPFFELNAEIARFMCLPEVQPGHMTYWSTSTSCGFTAHAGPPTTNHSSGQNDRPCFVYQNYSADASDNGLREIPHYSSDIGAAWQVVEYVRSLMYWFCLFDQRETPDKWRASFCWIGSQNVPIDAFGGTPAEAICLAVEKIIRIREAKT